MRVSVGLYQADMGGNIAVGVFDSAELISPTTRHGSYAVHV